MRNEKWTNKISGKKVKAKQNLSKRKGVHHCQILSREMGTMKSSMDTKDTKENKLNTIIVRPGRK